MTRAQHAWEESYIGQLRKLVGSRTLICPGARAIIRDEQGRLLLIRRRETPLLTNKHQPGALKANQRQREYDDVDSCKQTDQEG
jgi:hypothetical protein